MAKLTGHQISDVDEFYSSVFPSAFFDSNDITTAITNIVRGVHGGLISFTGTITTRLPYGAVILFYLQPTNERQAPLRPYIPASLEA